MIEDTPGLMAAVRSRFAHVDTCPFTGPRIFFENAGGALTLKSVVETSTRFAAIPDNQGRDNPASRALVGTIARARDDARVLMNAPDGQIFLGESGTEVLFRLIRTAAQAAPAGGTILGATLEHPASRSAAAQWAERTGRTHRLVAHDNATGTVTADHYRPHITPDTRVATIIQTSPVTGMAVDVAGISAEIRAVAPECFIVVDGIQHASHGAMDIDGYDIDGYAISPYKLFSRHGYGLGWASDRLTAAPLEHLKGGPEDNWELGTRDTGAYATFSDVVDYIAWLGGNFTDSKDQRTQIEAGAAAIHAQEAALTEAILHGIGNHRGLADIPGVTIIGGVDNPAREGLVSLTLDGMSASEVVTFLNARGIRTHTRKADHYSGNVLDPLGLEACVRIAYSHYNTRAEIAEFLAAMNDASAGMSH